MGDGPGLWCPLHITLIVVLFLWIITSFFLFRKYKNFALKLTSVLCFVMLFTRIFRMCLLYIAAKQTFIEILPWHLCHVMSFVFPIFYLFKIKKFFLPVLVVTFFGGLLTFLFGDYYYLSTLSFLHYESLLLHFMMPTVVIACISTGYFKVRFKDFWQAYVGLSLLVAWSSLGNYLIEGANYLYLVENGLPFTLFGAHFYWTYLVLVFVISVVTITPFYFYEKYKKKHRTDIDIIMNIINSPI